MHAFVGRAPELEYLSRALDEARAGIGSFTLIVGEAGIGKSRLGRELISRQRADGARCAIGAAWEVGGAPAYWPWLEALRSLDIPTPDLGGSEDSDRRFVFFDRIIRAIAEAARAAPLLLVLDDLHAADHPSLELTLYAARSLAAAPVALVGLARERELGARGPVGERLLRQGRCHALGALSEDEVRAWVGDSADPLAVLTITDGLPLFVEEVLRVGMNSNQRATPRLQTVLDEHLSHLGDETRRQLARASVLGRRFALADAQALGVDQDALGEAMDAAVLLSRVDEVEFSHVLLRDRLYDGLRPAERDELHWAIGCSLRSSGRLLEAAHHQFLGMRAGDIEAAACTARDAAAAELKNLAYETAAQLAHQGLSLTRDPGVHLELGLIECEALMRSGAGDDGRRKCATVFFEAEATGNGSGMARAALLYGMDLRTAIADPRMIAMLERTVSLPHDPGTTALLTARLAAARTPAATEAEALRSIDEARQAVELARTAPVASRLDVSYYAAAAMGYVASVAERRQLVDELVDLAVHAGRDDLIASMSGLQACCLIEDGRTQNLGALRDLLATTCARLGAPHYTWRLLAFDANLALLGGEFERALNLAEELEVVGAAHGNRSAWFAAFLLRAGAMQLTGDVAHITRYAGVAGTSAQPFRAWLLAATGDPGAHAALENAVLAMAAGRGAPGFPIGISLGEAAVLLNATGLAGRLLERLQMERGYNTFFWGPGGVYCFGPLARVCGDLAAMLDQHDLADTYYAEARHSCALVGSSVLLETVDRRIQATRDDSTPPVFSFRRDGAGYGLVWQGRTVAQLPASKGAEYLAALVGAAGGEIHVLELVGSAESSASAGPMLDDAAKSAYRARVAVLIATLQGADPADDGRQAVEARKELQFLAAELKRATGLGGRDRLAASNAERARVNVQRRIKDVIGRIAAADPELGEQIRRRTHTGLHCRFEPF